MKKFPPSSRHNQRGIALILVLASLVLLTVMVLAFLATTSTELQSSKFYANGSSVKLLAQSATDLVIGEIRDATQTGTLCWASQPGMIRTYDNTGSAISYYKLYSDGGMVGTGTFNNSQLLVPDGTGSTIAWYKQPGVYVDLNEPVTVNGVAQFPIVDGSASDYTASTATMTAVEGIPASSQVIGPALASGPYAGQPLVAGFSLGSTTPVATGATDQAPMPVKWLYVLKDGSIAYPDNATAAGTTSGTVTFSGAAAAGAEVPSAGNPIVGRIAFWTDDETSKVNINTAGESVSDRTVNATTTAVSISSGTTIRSTVWDVPRADSGTEIDMSRYPPAQNEFQRYPGHPATVSLSAVLGNVTMDSNFPECLYAPPSASIASTGLAPRLTQSTLGAATSGYWGGEVYSYVSTSTGGSLEGMQVPTGALPLTARRLYADTDELLFQPTLTAGVRGLNNTSLTATTELDNTMLRKTNFFLTAHSRAPDVNVFNQPRVCMWPLSSTTANWTADDKLIAFCSEVGRDSSSNPYPYFFQRSNPNDPGIDLPAALMTAGTAGAGNLNRNRNVLEYLRYLTQQPLPGFGGALGGNNGKYNGTDSIGGIGSTNGSTTYESDQILTEMFDYIRSTNIYDASTGAVPFTCRSATQLGQYSVDGNNTSAYNPGLGQVVPIVDQNGTRGFGRFPTVHSASLVFFPLQNTFVPVKNGANPPNYAREVSQIQAVLALQMFDPSMGFPQNIPWYQVKVILSGFTWQDGTNMFPNATSATPAILPNPYGGNYNAPNANCLADRQIGGMYDFRRMLLAGSSTYVVGATGAKFSDWNPGTASNAAYIYNGTPFTATATNPSPNGGALFSAPYPATVLTSTYTASNPAPTSAAAVLLPNPNATPASALSFTGGTVEIQIFNNNSTGVAASATPVQDIKFAFSGDSNLPLPANSVNFASIGSGFGIKENTVDHGPANQTSTTTPVNPTNWSATGETTSNEGWQLWANRITSLPDQTSTYAIDFIGDSDVTRSMMSATGDMRLLAARQTVPGSGSYFAAHPAFNTGARFAHDLQDGLNRMTGPWAGPCYGSSLVYASGFGSGGTGGALVPLTSLSPSYYYGLTSVSGLPIGDYAEYTGFGSSNQGSMWSDVPTQAGVFVGAVGGGSTTVPGDWDNGMADYKDGAFINKADEGSTFHGYNIDGGYFDPSSQTNPGTTYFSPNREVPSAGMFGSLSTGVLENIPWRTLLFRPGPGGHPGLGVSSAGGGDTGPPYTTPPDHLWMDLFTMPVVEPYAISEPLSTAGRINMNYQIVPFTYINRSTAVQAALRSVSVVSIPNTDGDWYKRNYYQTLPSNHEPYRHILNIPATLAQFTARFAANSLYRSPSEICSVDLVPSNCATPSATPGTTAWRTAMDSFWSQYALSGDNTRERPYADLYPLLTTKSNTFTIHYRVQTLTPSPANPSPTVWREGTDTITGEYRGSQTIERYIDPNDTAIPDFTASPSTTQSLAPYYRFRIVSTKQFAP